MLEQESICDVNFTKADRHDMVKVIITSTKISQEKKDAAFIKLKEYDNSDKFGLTEKYCQGALPTAESKRKVWELLMSPEAADMSLYQVQ